MSQTTCPACNVSRNGTHEPECELLRGGLVRQTIDPNAKTWLDKLSPIASPIQEASEREIIARELFEIDADSTIEMLGQQWDRATVDEAYFSRADRILAALRSPKQVGLEASERERECAGLIAQLEASHEYGESMTRHGGFGYLDRNHTALFKRAADALRSQVTLKEVEQLAQDAWYDDQENSFAGFWDAFSGRLRPLLEREQ